jgi:isopentenyl diphosphate isomerase/L-lactate dehydrogenase-like FMN-dependent dehydrogenase
MKEIRATAKELMQGYCRVCPVCNGKACAGEVPGMGGLGTGSAFMANVETLSRVRLAMRLIHDTTEPDTSVELLGHTLSVPVLAAPIGGVSFNMGGGRSEQEYIDAIIHGCAARGTLGCTGDGVPPFILDAACSALTAAGGRGIPFIKPWEDQELFEKLERVLACGVPMVGMDIDAAGLVTLRKMGRPVSPRPSKELQRIRERIPVPFILKGIMTPDQARLAVDAGVDAIVVSNHGGRVLDGTPGTAEVLPAVARAVGHQIPVLVDGGVRSGGDVLKMLALGARAVLIGRPFSVAAIGGLQSGVETYLDALTTELKQAMVMTGTASCRAVSSDILA